jgi:hypothetical protein
MFPTLCKVVADTSRIANTLPALRGSNGTYYLLEYDVVLEYGLREHRAHISWKENVRSLHFHSKLTQVSVPEGRREDVCISHYIPSIALTDAIPRKDAQLSLFMSNEDPFPPCGCVCIITRNDLQCLFVFFRNRHAKSNPQPKQVIGRDRNVDDLSIRLVIIC